MPTKRARAEDGNDDDRDGARRAAKRQRGGPVSGGPRPSPPHPRRGTPDVISTLSDELLVRILSFLSPQSLLGIAPVSRRFHRLASDAQLWKSLYYARFVRPRALRIPGFRDGQPQPAAVAASSSGSATKRHRLHYTNRRALWTDGRRGGLVEEGRGGDWGHARDDAAGDSKNKRRASVAGVVDWKRQFKIRHNWARGACAVEELKMGPDDDASFLTSSGHEDGGGDGAKMLVKVVEGIAVTADRASGLRAWDLKTRRLLAQAGDGDGEAVAPTCIAVDEQAFADGILDIAVGFSDGSFSIWQLDFGSRKTLALRCRHGRSTNGALIGMAFSYPYLLTATESVLVSLYTFRGPAAEGEAEDSDSLPGGPEQMHGPGHKGGEGSVAPLLVLPAPYLLTSLRSHSSRPPLALSIRKLVLGAVASIAYTFSTLQGWSIGIQDLHIKAPQARRKTVAAAAAAAAVAAAATPEVSATRLAFTAQISNSGRSSGSSAPAAAAGQEVSPWPGHQLEPELGGGPTALCYTHPYLLATLPDNTLILYLCTSSASALTISAGTRLWGHTSGISDAEITARGKAVSVSSHGDEMRVWELEGRAAALHGRSVEVRPTPDGRDERRIGWVGFDDEMVIVLKESKAGRESLVVYDFT